MEISKPLIEGLIVFTPKIYGDQRGCFFESFNEKIFEKATGHTYRFVQDNQSNSIKGVLRGLHFQNPPHAQGKLVRVVKGAVLDVAVDIRNGSESYGKYFAIELSELNNKQLWIPPGFAHGFIALEDNTIFSYKCTNYYVPESEGTLKWNDTTLNIDWKINPLFISDKDEQGEEFSTFVSNFEN